MKVKDGYQVLKVQGLLLLLAGCLAYVFGEVLAKSASSETVEVFKVIAGIFAIGCVVLVGLCIRILVGIASACPKCHTLWAAKLQDVETLARRRGASTVLRQDVHRDSQGNRIGSTDREEQVLVTRSLLRNYYKCDCCGHEWTDLTVEEREGW
jgi:hypothetical protein